MVHWKSKTDGPFIYIYIYIYSNREQSYVASRKLPVAVGRSTYAACSSAPHVPMSHSHVRVCILLRQKITMQMQENHPNRIARALCLPTTLVVSKENSRCRLPSSRCRTPPIRHSSTCTTTFSSSSISFHVSARHYSANIVLAYPFFFDKLRKTSRTFTSLFTRQSIVMVRSLACTVLLLDMDLFSYRTLLAWHIFFNKQSGPGRWRGSRWQAGWLPFTSR